MQERYLGDSHDFLKYALLRRLHARTGMRLGINWYRTEPEAVDQLGNNDGEKRHHLKGGVWQQADPDLFGKIHRFEDHVNRRLANVEKWELLPSGTVYFEQNVCRVDRQAWHEQALASLASLIHDARFRARSGHLLRLAVLRGRPASLAFVSPHSD